MIGEHRENIPELSVLCSSVKRIKERSDFFCFDQFIAEKMMGRSGVTLTKELRYKAYRICLSRMGNERVAAIQTIQKWFGLGGKTVPSRENIFQLGFSLHLSVAEVRDYLVNGLHEPDLQVNDYREMIFMYGYHKNMSYAETRQLIERFERKMRADIQISQEAHTLELWDEYGKKRSFGKTEFLMWMLNRSENFKGYSKTVLECFQSLKYEILTEVKEEAERQLEEYLEQIGFAAWEKTHRFLPKKRTRMIRHYIRTETKKNYRNVSEQMEKMILELLEMAHMSVDSNSELLAELYASVNVRLRNFKTNNKKDDEKKRFPINTNLMTNKHLSDLLNMGINKEKQIVFAVCKSHLAGMSGTELCPRELFDTIRLYGYDPLVGDSVENVRNWLNKKEKEQGRRCQLIHRSDLLPLVLCAAQKRYLKSISQGGEYNYIEARNVFMELANSILKSCHMALMNPDCYELDAILLLCYQKEEMYFLPEILEELVV